MKYKEPTDWKIKDKIYIIINIVNKRLLLKNPNSHLLGVEEVIRMIKKISKKENISMLEALQNSINYLHNNKDSIKLYKGEK